MTNVTRISPSYVTYSSGRQLRAAREQACVYPICRDITMGAPGHLPAKCEPRDGRVVDEALHGV